MLSSRQQIMEKHVNATLIIKMYMNLWKNMMVKNGQYFVMIASICMLGLIQKMINGCLLEPEAVSISFT